MKISVYNTIYYWFGKVQANYKYHEFQISLLFKASFSILLDIDFEKTFGNLFTIHLNIFSLFTVHLYKNKEVDHAGFYLNINILGLDIDYSYKDVRHWDYDNNKWEEYN